MGGHSSEFPGCGKPERYALIYMKPKKFNGNIFATSSIIFGFVLVPSFLAAWAEDEGHSQAGIGGIFTKLFYVLRFPTHTLFSFFFTLHPVLFFIGLLINCTFYGFIIERIWSLFGRKRSNA